MIRNFLKIAFRSIVNDKFYSLINITGLAIGIACSLLIALYVVDELSFDKFHADADRIFRIDQTNIWSGNTEQIGVTGPPVAEAVRAEVPEVEHSTRIRVVGNMLVTKQGSSPVAFDESRIFLTDSTFFDVFSFEMLQGDPQTALDEQGSIVISASTAEKYFGEEEALGKTLLMGDDRVPFVITGVVADIPDNSHFTFNMLATMDLDPLIERYEWSWIWTQMTTYVKLRPDTDIGAVEEKLLGVPKKYAGNSMKLIFGYTFEEYEAKGSTWELFLTPMTDIHLYTATVGDRLGEHSDILYVYVFISIAVFIVLIACINFMNLTTARSAKRAKETGVRKALGSTRQGLTGQFLTESMLLTAVAMLLSLGVAELLKIPFNELSGKDLSLTSLADPVLASMFIGLALTLGLLTGSYPAFYLSSFRPASVLRGNLRAGLKSGRLRNTLVVIQFAISMVLISVTQVVFKQINYARNINLGFDKENILLLGNVQRLGNDLEPFKEELATYAEVKSIATSSDTPPRIYGEDLYKAKGSDQAEFPINTIATDYDYANTLGFELVEGRYFSRESPSDIHGVVLNETAVQRLGWDDPIGQRVTKDGGSREFEVIGVIKDFHFRSMYETIEPFAFFHLEGKHWRMPNTVLSMKVQSSDLVGFVERVEDKWQSIAEGRPFEFSFLDSAIDRTLQSEVAIGRVITAFTGLAIFIACLGLMGLAAFAAEQKTKEIGIRKVLGASVSSIVTLIARDFTKLILVAFIIAAPLGYYAADWWLQDFAYKTNLTLLPLVFAGAIALVVALFTVSYQAIKAGSTDPVKSLRSE